MRLVGKTVRSVNIYWKINYLHSWIVYQERVCRVIHWDIKGWDTFALDSRMTVCYLLSFSLADTLTAEWLAVQWSSANQLFGPGLLHNYIKAWSTARPQHTRYKYNVNSSPRSSSLCTPFPSSYPCYYASMLEEAPDHSPLVICVSAPAVTRYVKMHVSVSGFGRRCTINTEGWSVVRFSMSLKACRWCTVVEMFWKVCRFYSMIR